MCCLRKEKTSIVTLAISPISDCEPVRPITPKESPYYKALCVVCILSFQCEQPF